MGFTTGEKGGALAEVRARTALRDAGLDPAAPLERMSSVTNEVWLTPAHAVRVNRSHGSRLAREAQLATVLPPEVGYPPVVAHGRGHGEDWLISERIPGRPLAHLWPAMAPATRRAAVAQLATRLAALHATGAPADLAPVHDPPQLLDLGAADPTAPIRDALARASRLDHVDPLLVRDAVELVTRTADALTTSPPRALIHGDLTFENVLWHEGEVTALLDVEWARPGPADLDLDVFLRCCAYPQLHVAEAHATTTRPEDYADVPAWLAEDHPALFDQPRLIERLRIYSISYDVRALLALPPHVPAGELPREHAYHRLAEVVHRHSHLDVLARRLS